MDSFRKLKFTNAFLLFTSILVLETDDESDGFSSLVVSTAAVQIDTGPSRSPYRAVQECPPTRVGLSSIRDGLSSIRAASSWCRIK
jgi:hypothetical protein